MSGSFGEHANNRIRVVDRATDGAVNFGMFTAETGDHQVA
jgi:hypothetical protein